MQKKGFTLIELLIVIALLGVLAVGLLAAIDPLEQFRKGTDTSVRSIVSELHNGIIRSYASLSRMPWDSDPNAAQYVDDLASSPSVTDNVIRPVINTGELKSSFIELAGDRLSRIWVAGQDSGAPGNPLNPQIIVCFRPESRSQRCDANTRYTINQDGQGINSVSLNTTTCNADNCGNANYDCYWCVGDVPTQ